jgi:hypothetical protein
MALVIFVCAIYKTAQEHTTFVQYGIASSLPDRQAASSPAGANALSGAQRRTVRSTP